ncbi:hypothetical protein [Phycisphaera mikurensis]|uniref:Lipoprotein n=1 Tax=Phycisphaera mikurensis (strain NBRC 102666 / KCTC 22515 / FYK2301M01) TaxID=1142394 RepID=I0IFC9_PHYMF|nr:hypothetical protein [Phycisphaera mikurensis]MBB6440640.1 hypothetical protein [Phycisphaera mikurensis]BAM03967.1 hypothetical protein PSMK_18080 [Phycisphaera mikurensis NBRC 102666]
MTGRCVAIGFLCGLLALGGCRGRSSLDGAVVRTSEVPAEGSVRGRPTLGSPIRIGNSSTALIPFALGEPKTFGDRFRLPTKETIRGWFFGPPVPREGNLFAGPGPQAIYWQNAVFADPLTGRAEPLLRHRAVIVQAVLIDRQQAPALAEGLWAFTVVSRDTNGDGWLRGDDTGVVLLTSPTGAWARLATGDNDDRGGEQLVSISEQPGTAFLLMRLRRDADGDGRFTTEDPVEPWVIDPARGGPAERLVPLETVGRLERLAR